MWFIELIKDLSILLAAWAVLYGVDAWRREHRGKRQIELAEEVLASFYQAADAIRYVRSPGSWSSETDHVVRAENESDKQFDARKNAAIVSKRFHDERELFSSLHSLRYRFMAQVGREKAGPFGDLRLIVAEIQSAADLLARIWSYEYDPFAQPEEAERKRKEREQYEKVFWHGFGDDPIEPKLQAVVAEIEATCRHVISGSGTLHGVLNARMPWMK